MKLPWRLWGPHSPFFRGQWGPFPRIKSTATWSWTLSSI